MTDPLSAFIARDRAALLIAAPSPNAARLWHHARRRRATALRRLTMALGWAVRASVAFAAIGAWLSGWRDVPFPLFLLCLCAWLTRHACAAARTSTARPHAHALENRS